MLPAPSTRNHPFSIPLVSAEPSVPDGCPKGDAAQRSNTTLMGQKRSGVRTAFMLPPRVSPAPRCRALGGLSTASQLRQEAEGVPMRCRGHGGVLRLVEYVAMEGGSEWGAGMEGLYLGPGGGLSFMDSSPPSDHFSPMGAGACTSGKLELQAEPDRRPRRSLGCKPRSGQSNHCTTSPPQEQKRGNCVLDQQP